MVLRKLALFSFVSLLCATGCSKSKQKGGSGEMESDLTGTGTISSQDLQLQNQERFAGGNIPLAEGGGMFRDVHFEFNSSQLTPEGTEIVRENAQKLSSDPSLKVQVEGHCDKRGTSEFNMALGEERAKSVARLLTTYGVKPSQVSIVSYGEEVPLDPSDSEEAYAKNRRAHMAPSGRGGNAQLSAPDDRAY